MLLTTLGYLWTACNSQLSAEISNGLAWFSRTSAVKGIKSVRCVWVSVSLLVSTLTDETFDACTQNLVEGLTDGRTDGRTDGQTNECYQVHYPPALLSYVVDKNLKHLFTSLCKRGPSVNIKYFSTIFGIAYKNFDIYSGVSVQKLQKIQERVKTRRTLSGQRWTYCVNLTCQVSWRTYCVPSGPPVALLPPSYCYSGETDCQEM